MLPLDPKKTGSESNLARPAPDRLPAGPPGFAGWMPGMDMANPGLANGSANSSTMTQALKRRWPVLLGLGLVGGLVAGLVGWQLSPATYTTQTLLEFERPLKAEGEFDIVNFKRTQAAVLKGSAVLQAAVTKPNVADLSEVRSQNDVLGWLAKNLVTDELLGPGILRVNLTGDNPDDLPVVLNEIVLAYLKEFSDNERAKVESRVKQLQVFFKTCADQLRLKRQVFHKEKESLRLDDPETIQARLRNAENELAATRAPRVQLNLQLQEAEADLSTQEDLLNHPEKVKIPNYLVELELEQDAVVKKHLDNLSLVEFNIILNKARIVRSRQDKELKPLFDERDSIKKTLEATQERMRPPVLARLRAKRLGELRDNVDKLIAKIKLTRNQIASLDREIKRRENEVEALRFANRSPDKLPPKLLEIKDEVDQKELELKRIGEELGALRFGSTSPRVVQRETAKIPQDRDMKKQLKVAGGAGLGVFALIFAGLLLLETRKRRIYGASDVVQGLGINLLGTLPALPAANRKPLLSGKSSADLYWQNIMTESVDVLRTVILHSAQVDSLRVVMVTSAVEGEGKTSLASHLAASLARAWKRTLLIDGDLRNPAAHQQFDVPLEPGLSELLRGEVEVDDVIRPTPVSRLWMIPAGKWDSHAVQALGQEGVGGTFEHLKDQYDFIVIDACPVLPVADSMVIGQHADAVVFSIMKEVSQVPAVQEAYQRMANLGMHMLGAVVIGEKAHTYGRAFTYLNPPSK